MCRAAIVTIRVHDPISDFIATKTMDSDRSSRTWRLRLHRKCTAPYEVTWFMAVDVTCWGQVLLVQHNYTSLGIDGRSVVLFFE